MPGADYTSKRLTVAQRGINKELEPTLMKGMHTPYMKNMMIDKGGLRKFLGYSKFCYNPDLRSIGGSEIGCALKESISFAGTHYLFAFTNKTAFVSVWNYQQDRTWANINPGDFVHRMDDAWTDNHANITVTTTLTDSIYYSSLKLAGDSSFSDDTLICYDNFAANDLSDYSYICGWIKKIGTFGDALHLVISESADGAKAGDYVTVDLPVDNISNDEWRFFCVAVDLSAINAAVSVGVWNDSDITWSASHVVLIDEVRAINLLNHDYADNHTRYDFATVTDVNEFTGTKSDGRALIISPRNDTDDLLYFEHWGDHYWELHALDHGIPNFKYAACIIEFWNHFFIGGYEATDYAFSSLAHAGLGDIDDWSSDASGFYTLTDTQGRILRFTKNDYQMNIYSDHSISRGLWYGSYILFTFPCIMPKLGLFGAGALWQDTAGDFFVGSDRRFYFMPIGQKPIGIGVPVEKTIFADEYAASYRTYLVCGSHERMKRILFAIPTSTGSQTFPKSVYGYDKINRSWEYYLFAHEIRDFEVSTIDGDADGYFIDENCIVYKIDEPSTGLMDDQEIACEYQTEDVTIDDEHSNARWKWFTFTAKSSIASKTVVVQYSIDNGSTWTAFDDSPVSLTSAWVTHRLPLDVLSRVIRFRFTQTSGDLQIKANMFYGFSPDTEE